jgi:hypothetical protein
MSTGCSAAQALEAQLKLTRSAGFNPLWYRDCIPIAAPLGLSRERNASYLRLMLVAPLSFPRSAVGWYNRTDVAGLFGRRSIDGHRVSAREAYDLRGKVRYRIYIAP